MLHSILWPIIPQDHMLHGILWPTIILPYYDRKRSKTSLSEISWMIFFFFYCSKVVNKNPYMQTRIKFMVQIYPCMSFASSSEILLALVLNKVHHDFLAQLEWLSPMTLRDENTLPAPRYYYNFFFHPINLRTSLKKKNN